MGKRKLASRSKRNLTDELEADTATAVGLPPYDVAEEELPFLPEDANQDVYVVIRNHVLTKWRADVYRHLKAEDALDVIQKKFYPLVEAAHKFLETYGYINFGVAPALKHLTPPPDVEKKCTVVIIGAGLAAPARLAKQPSQRKPADSGAALPQTTPLSTSTKTSGWGWRLLNSSALLTGPDWTVWTSGLLNSGSAPDWTCLDSWKLSAQRAALLTGPAWTRGNCLRRAGGGAAAAQLRSQGGGAGGPASPGRTRVHQKDGGARRRRAGGGGPWRERHQRHRWQPTRRFGQAVAGAAAPHSVQVPAVFGGRVAGAVGGGQLGGAAVQHPFGRLQPVAGGGGRLRREPYPPLHRHRDVPEGANPRWITTNAFYLLRERIGSLVRPKEKAERVLARSPVTPTKRRTRTTYSTLRLNSPVLLMGIVV
eukprot:1184743-Prorocentrum_minimum.AAC.3